MSAVDEPSRSPDEGASSKINPRNKPRCLAEGMIPWLAGHIEWVPIAEIKVSSPSLRRHNRHQIRRLKKLMREYGFTTPILVDQNGNCIAGEARLLASVELGLDVVPVIRIAHLTDVQVRALKLADNRIAEMAEWNWDEVARELEALSKLEFEIDLTGFAVAETDLIIAKHLPKPHDLALDDCPPVDRAGLAVARMGDIFLLGEHRIVCGDSRNAELVSRLMAGVSATASFSDPPYNVEIEGNVSGLGKVKHGEFAMASGEMSDEEFVEFLVAYLTLAAQISVDGAVHFACMDWRHVDLLIRAIKIIGGTLLNICTWVKSNAGMGSFYRSQTEFVAVFKTGDAPHRNNIELGAHGRNRSNYWAYEGANSINPARRKELALHPTVKPVRLVADAILDCTARGDVVYDAFLGSGSTVIAAEETGRICYGVEISPQYVDVIVCRWQEFTGDHAVHAESGLTFDELARRRSGPKLLPAPTVRTEA